VTSRHSTARHRRHGRSYTGGSSYIPQNEFPVFTHTGDVEIVISAGGKDNRYCLHRLILAQCSGFFEASTSQEWSKAAPSEGSSQVAVSGGLARKWKYELDTGAETEDIPMLVQKSSQEDSLFGSGDFRPPPQVRNKPISSQTSFFRSVANLGMVTAPQSQPLSQEDEDLLRDYDNLFRIFYNYAPALDAINIADAYMQCKTLLSLADLYDALPVVGPRIDHHLLQFQSRLWKQIAKYPTSYLKLGYLARSKTIYAEALIHVVGQWPVGERHLRNTLPECVLEVVEDKVLELAETVARVEGQLYRLTLYTSRGERVAPANAYMEWTVVSLFRQWLADNTSPTPVAVAKTATPQSRHRHDHNSRTQPPESQSPQTTAPPLGRTYRLLGSTNTSSYLGHEECRRFLKLTPEQYSRDALKRFERRMDELKSMVREACRPLLRCELQLENLEGVNYLTCTRVVKEDFCWEAEG
jgi:hypothetical protein